MIGQISNIAQHLAMMIGL